MTEKISKVHQEQAQINKEKREMIKEKHTTLRLGVLRPPAASGPLLTEKLFHQLEAEFVAAVETNDVCCTVYYSNKAIPSHYYVRVACMEKNLYMFALHVYNTTDTS